MDAGIASSSTAITRAAQAEVQPFFRARVFPASALHLSPHPTSFLSALRSSLAHAFKDFLSRPLPFGLDGYVFYKSTVHIKVSQGSVSKDGKRVIPPHVRLDLQTGGATEDEFALVHFLRLQQQSGGLLSDCYVQVHDEDGEFLLIEAADHLPQWIDPENADGRVWLVAQVLRLIPPSLDDVSNSPASSRVSPITDLRKAFDALSQPSDDAQTPQPLNDAAFSRMSSYPGTEWIDTVQHRTTAYITSSLAAHMFHHQPQLVARAGQAFLGRDSRDMRLAAKMETFGTHKAGTEIDQAPVRTPPDGSASLLIPLLIPRRLYVQLLSVRFLPPKCFPARYKEHIGQYYEDLDSLETSSATSSKQTKLDEGRRWDLGCKLSVGLEIAYWNDRERSASLSRTRGRLFDNKQSAPPENTNFRSDDEYESFIANLVKLGYFENEIRDSQKWKSLEAQAVKDWGQTRSTGRENVEDSSSGDEDDDDDSRWVALVKDLSSSNISGDITSLDPGDLAVIAAREQSDSWLYEAGDSFLTGDQNDEKKGTSQEEAEREATQRLSDFASQVENFIEGKGDVEGATIDASESEEDQTDSEGEDEMDLDGEDDATAALEARKQIERLSESERAERLKTLLPSLGEHVHWPAEVRDIDEQPNEEQLQGADSQMAQKEKVPSVLASKSSDVATGDNSESIDPKKKSQPTPLSSKNLRESLHSQAKAYRSSTVASRFDGAESWQLEDSDNDSEAGLDENGQPETKEQRRERARLLDLEYSEDESEEEEDEEEAGIAKNGEAKELDEFVEFARKELGLTEEQLAKIMKDRRDSGRWVPEKQTTSLKVPDSTVPDSKKGNADSPLASSPSFGKGFKQGFLSRPTATLSTNPNGSTVKTKSVSFAHSPGETQAPSPANPLSTASQPTTTKPRDASLNSFESLMGAMDAALDAHRRSKGLAPLNREELYKGGVRAEDWALRRPGGASLGSVIMSQHEQNAKRDQEERKTQADLDPQQMESSHKGKSKETQGSTSVSLSERNVSDESMDEDEDEADSEPLSAKDTALLDRLLQEQGKGAPTFKELIASVDVRSHNVASPAKGEPNGATIAKITEEGEDDVLNENKNNNGDEDMFPDVAMEDDGVNEEADGNEGAAISNLLESWRAQGGAPGPMGTLAGGMGFGSRAPR